MGFGYKSSSEVSWTLFSVRSWKKQIEELSIYTEGMVLSNGVEGCMANK